ncbi:MAG: 39S ribosomal protein L45 [Alphaproteobacteria bacterium]|nr:39S ribosomal protein L45 [Alphaproteobacteria bacterium]MDE2340702.1 Tim44 domain-containing protein [Alphaproteobacteria bacterium]
MVGIVIFGMLAVFFGLRLFAILGRRTGHEQNLAPVREEVTRTAPAIEDMNRAGPFTNALPAQDPQVINGIKAIVSADNHFDSGRFVEGAKSAYKMILEAFWRGDEVELATLASEDVRSSFSEAIVARTTSGHRLDNRLVSIERVEILKAWLENKVAHITVKFIADIAAVTRDDSGKVVAGSLTDAVPTTDIWTFSRIVKASSPEWTLTDTAESA